VTRPLTVQFYVFRNVHWPMFEELFQYLGTRPEVGERIICVPSLARLRNGQSDALAEKLFGLGVPVTTRPNARPVDVTFIADTVAGLVRGCGAIVNVGHGTISKGYYFTDSIWTERENWVDLLCVPGEYAATCFAPVLRTRVVATGMPKLDPVFSGRHSRAALCDAHDIDPSRRLVLYAPTFNEDLSSAYLFADRFAELAGRDRVLLVKLHGSTPPGTIAAYRALAARTPGVVFVDDPNIAPYLGGADVLVSDVSSVVMEFMALDKPVILFDHPQMTRYHGYNPNDIEHAWRDLGTRVGSFDAAKEALQDVLAHGDNRGPRRRAYAARLFADREGGASARVWEATLDTLAARAAEPTRPPLVPLWSLLLQITPDNLFLIRWLLDQVQFLGVMPAELRLVQYGTSAALERYVALLRRHSRFTSVSVSIAADAASVESTLAEAARTAPGDYLLFLRPNVIPYRGFDYFLHETFRRHPGVAALTPVFTAGAEPNRAPFAKGPLEGVTGERAAYQFINWHRGESIADFKSSTAPPAIAMRRAVLKRLPAAFFTGLAGLSASGLLKAAPSVSCGVMPPAVIQDALAYLTAPDAERSGQVAGILESGIAAIFPDVAAQLLRDVATVADHDRLEGILAMALRERLLDLAEQKALRAVLRRHPRLTRTLDHTIALAERLLHAVRASQPDGVQSATALAG
jgi:hypothetical protein